MIWLLVGDAAYAVAFAVCLVADSVHLPRPHWSALLTFVTRTRER